MQREWLRKAQSRAGFTIVELLVVVAVIAVLAGLLLAGVGSARDSARRTTCISNLRQIGHAVRMYIDDYGDRPPRFQALWAGGLIKSKELLLCPNDWTGNWGGLFYDQERQRDERGTPPETIHYSYIYPYATEPKRWKRLVEIEGSNAGIAVCQLHGQRHRSMLGPSGPMPSMLDYEGTILRLQLDGAVVQKRITWTRRSISGAAVTSGQLWSLLSDAPSPRL
jgi:prepilin-type N-terminal cleavage/methylation domain-containing protein